ncbi:hypothetical protein DL767_005592 [Monosporascus sp. MG133]|nr:hypothetical protein DL767_005592 [Monosporascus sp. MG133]
MATIDLDNQIFYTPSLAAGGPKLTSRSVLARDGNLSAAISGAFLHKLSLSPPQLQDAHDPRYGGSGASPDDAVLISDGESDCGDFDDSRSDTTFPPLEELLTAPRNEVQSNCVAGTEDKDISATPRGSGDSDAKEHSVTGGADSDDESVSTQHQQSRNLENGSREGIVWSDEGDESELATAEPTLQPADGQGQIDFRCNVGGHCNTNLEEDCRPIHPPVPDDRGEQDADGSVVPPQVQEGRTSIPRLSDDVSNKDLELANTEPFTQPSTSQDLVILQRNIGRRRYCDADDGEGYRHIVGSDTEYSQDDDVARPRRRKRRRISTSTPATCGTVPKRQGLTLREEVVDVISAKFEEWPLEDTVLKRVIMDGLVTFQLQFTWDLCTESGTGHQAVESEPSISSPKRHVSARHGSTTSTKDKDTTANPKPTSKRARYTLEDDTKIRQLKEKGLSWRAIAKQFPGRSLGAIEVMYHTKLKTDDTSQAPSLVVGDDGEVEEWKVEEICGRRTLDDGGVELHVEWEDGSKTWEPYDENLTQLEALDEYERIHGPVTVDTI